MNRKKREKAAFNKGRIMICGRLDTSKIASKQNLQLPANDGASVTELHCKLKKNSRGRNKHVLIGTMNVKLGANNFVRNRWQ